jgi:sulfatase modifying factor 1
MKLLLQNIFSFIFFFTVSLLCGQTKNSPGIQWVKIPAGEFKMGSEGKGENADEAPAHEVRLTKSFLMSATEITNRQYELFDPSHKKLRGLNGFSNEDDEAAVFISYEEAIAYCKWLSAKEKKQCRLPTEAEWEYACRAGTSTAFFTGDELPAIYHKQQVNERDPKPVSLRVAQTPANAWGLFDMHGNVEEWCIDWYGPYTPQKQIDPVGYADGLFRVTRGGSHNTEVRYLRAANRMAMIPSDKHWLTGFRVAQSELPASKPLPVYVKPKENFARQKITYPVTKQALPFFAEPVPYIVTPSANSGVPFYDHNHCPAITGLPNGDLLAIWFSTNDESGREMSILQSRYRYSKKSWDTASLFIKVPDRNMTGSSLLLDKSGTIFHLNGVEASGDWQNLAIFMRKSVDNGYTWTKPAIIAPEHRRGHQVIAGIIQTKEGWLLQPCDAEAGPVGGTVLQISKDNGNSWEQSAILPDTNQFTAGNRGGLIAGIHAGLVQLKNGNLLALGRNNNIRDNDGIERMPMSISTDMGKSWTYSASPFLPIESGQRLVLMRLKEGPILLLSFTHSPGKSNEEGMMMTTAAGLQKHSGLFAALSYDEGQTWPVRKLITDGIKRELNGGAWTKGFVMDSTHAEPKGYLAATQTPDGFIHLLSSNLYYRFNLSWLQQN